MANVSWFSSLFSDNGYLQDGPWGCILHSSFQACGRTWWLHSRSCSLFWCIIYQVSQVDRLLHRLISLMFFCFSFVNFIVWIKFCFLVDLVNTWVWKGKRKHVFYAWDVTWCLHGIWSCPKDTGDRIIVPIRFSKFMESIWIYIHGTSKNFLEWKVISPLVEMFV